jgi:hypothetical protein
MERRFRIAAVGTLALLASTALAGSAHGDGLPVPFEGTQSGVVAPGAESRYTTVSAGRSGTMVLRTSVGGGEVERSRVIRGVFTVPAVAYDGSASGLSADGATLVLIRPRRGFPRQRTTFAVVAAPRLRVEKRISLNGDFSFDALSPDGRTMYLIEYVDRRDPTAYQVRAYDLERERLHPDPIVDPHAAPVTMGGTPQTRAVSPDGRWAYTLYDSLDPGRPAFIHALDTETGEAACIILEDGLLNRNLLGQMELEPSADGATIAIVHRGDPVALVDTETWGVSEPAAEADDAAGGGEEPGWMPWIPLALVGLAAAALIAVVRRRRRSRAVDAGELERLVEIDGEPGSTAVEAGERASERDPIP